METILNSLKPFKIEWKLLWNSLKPFEIENKLFEMVKTILNRK